MFHFSNAAKTLVTRRFVSGVHQPFRLKIKGPIPEFAGVEDMVTKLWPVNPGLVVFGSSVGMFFLGMGIHVMFKGATVNTGVEKAMMQEAAKKA